MLHVYRSFFCLVCVRNSDEFVLRAFLQADTATVCIELSIDDCLDRYERDPQQFIYDIMQVLLYLGLRTLSWNPPTGSCGEVI